MTNKRFLAGLFATMLMISVAIPASASSNDTNFKFLFGTGGGQTMDRYTSRDKDNASSTYIHIKTGNEAKTVRIYGTYKLGVITRNSRGGYSDVVDCTKPFYSTPTVKIGQRGFIRQLVYEKGYPYAAIGSWGIWSTVTGVWSPDSVPESGVKTLN